MTRKTKSDRFPSTAAKERQRQNPAPRGGRRRRKEERRRAVKRKKRKVSTKRTGK